MKIANKLILGLLILTPGLYAMDGERKTQAEADAAQFEKEQAAKMAQSAAAADEREEAFERAVEAAETIARERSSVVLPPQTEEQAKKLDALYEAILSRNDSLMKTLLASGMNVNGRRSGVENCSLVHEVCDTPKVVELLLHAGADVNSITIEKQTPLHRYCRAADMRFFKISDLTECMRLMLTQPKVAVNAQDIYLRTPLHDLLNSYHDYSRVAPMVSLLLEHGANSNMVDARRKTVFDYALEKSDMDKHTRPDIRNVLLLFAAHRAKIDATAAALRDCGVFPYYGKNTTDRMVAEYCCGIRPKNEKLDAALIKVNALLKD